MSLLFLFFEVGSHRGDGWRENQAELKVTDTQDRVKQGQEKAKTVARFTYIDFKYLC